MAIKSIKQNFSPNQDLQLLMETFKDMVNHCIRIGLENNCSTLKKLSLLAYHELNQYNISSSYKLNAISQACGRLSQMKKDIKKGRKVKSPFVQKPYATNCYSFRINGMLHTIPYKKGYRINILLNHHTVDMISEYEVKSFTITPTSLSLSVKKEVSEIIPESAVGIDRNLGNITVGNKEKVTVYSTTKLGIIKNNTSFVVASFKRNDHRARKRFYSKILNRRNRRVKQFLHKISKDIVHNAVKTKSMIVFEDLKGIRKLYRKGNGQGNRHRKKMNSWSFYELQRQVEYKARWEGIPVRFVNPRRTSKLCPVCGDRIQEDMYNRRKLWCSNCRKSMDRDVVASLNISYKGWARFTHPRCATDEAMVQEPRLLNYNDLAILKVDVAKSTVGSNP